MHFGEIGSTSILFGLKKINGGSQVYFGSLDETYIIWTERDWQDKLVPQGNAISHMLSMMFWLQRSVDVIGGIWAEK